MTLIPRFATVLIAGTLVCAAISQKKHASTTPRRPSETITKSEQVRILIAPAVKVSQTNFSKPHFEVQVAADPTDVRRLVACSMMFGDDHIDDQKTYLRPYPLYIVVYTSLDGGLSWQPTLIERQHNTDPTCVFGPDGSAYFMSFGGDIYTAISWARQQSQSRGSTKEFIQSPTHFTMSMYRSSDGAKTWNEVGETEILDREYVTVDDTSGKYRGRLYVNGVANTGVGIGIAGLDGGRISGIAISRSKDRGQTYESVKLASEGSEYVIENGNGIVMTDGTFAAIFGEVYDDPHTANSKGSMHEMHPVAPNGKLRFIASYDGGETFGRATVVSDWYLRWNGNMQGMPSLAVDRTDGPFHDRLYAAWVDMRSGRGEIRFARSEDKGKTWSPSFVISDNWPHDERGETPDAFMPVLAVNHSGVLGVIWYDRRDHPDNLGYDIRFSASVDGGESFLPSTLVSPGGGSALQMSEALLTGPWLASVDAEGRAHAGFRWYFHAHGGDTAGLAADADGIFHAMWIDRRSGVQQLCTTRITVNGPAMINGGRGLESLRDLSASTEVRYSLALLDFAKNEVTIGAAIANTSKEAIPGRLTLRVLGLSSNSGLIEAQNADNGFSTSGAIWEFHASSGDSLQPGTLTAPRTLRFKLGHSPFPPRPIGEKLDRAVVEIDTKIIGQ